MANSYSNSYSHYGPMKYTDQLFTTTQYATINSTKNDTRNVFAPVTNDLPIQYIPYGNTKCPQLLPVDHGHLENTIGPEMEKAFSRNCGQSFNPFFKPKKMTDLFLKDNFCKQGMNSTAQYAQVDSKNNAPCRPNQYYPTECPNRKTFYGLNWKCCDQESLSYGTLANIPVYNCLKEQMSEPKHFLKPCMDQEDFLNKEFIQPIKKIYMLGEKHGDVAFHPSTNRISCKNKYIMAHEI